LVVLSCRLERVWRNDGLARVVDLAAAPRGALGRRRADQHARRREVGAPHGLQRRRAVAAEVARIGPEVAVEIEVLRGEEVALERHDAVGHFAVPGGLLAFAFEAAADVGELVYE